MLINTLLDTTSTLSSKAAANPGSKLIALLPIIILVFIGIIILAVFVTKKAIKKYRENNKKRNRKYYPSFVVIAVVYCLLSTALSIIIPKNFSLWSNDYFVFQITVALILSPLEVWFYFLPYLIANKKKHLQTRAIYILNIFAGWTIIAWIIALIWANTVAKEATIITAPTPTLSVADELKKYKELLDAGAITPEEFEQKKHQLLENK